MSTTPHKTSKLTYLVLVLGVLVAALVYFYISGNKTPESLTLQALDNANQVAGVKVLNLLNEINSLKIDGAVFNDSSYRTLRDYTVEIPELPVGRSNPFSPVPGMVTSPGAGR